MRARSDVAPKPVIVDKIGDKAHISLSTNIELMDDGYEYDYYLVVVDWRDGLKAEVENAFDVWLSYAQATNYEKPSIEQRLEALEKIELERILYDLFSKDTI